MGAFSPSRLITESLQDRLIQEIIVPTLRALEKRGIEYRGVLYAGLMMTDAGPRLLEYNVRFGDPETQSLVVRLEGDLLELIEACIAGRLAETTAKWNEKVSVCVVMAAHGYPGETRKGDPISGLDRTAQIRETVVFHAGTLLQEGRLVTAGGRVLGVTSLGKDLREARERAYDACEKIYWNGLHFRKDIGGIR